MMYAYTQWKELKYVINDITPLSMPTLFQSNKNSSIAE